MAAMLLRRSAATSSARHALPAARTFFSSSKETKEPAPAPADNKEVVSVSETNQLLYNGIRAIGYDDADAKVMRDAMMWAQLRDNNQGIIKLTSGGLAKSGDGVPTIELDSPNGARINGQQAMSMVVVDKAVNLAIEKAKANHVGIVGTFNTSQSCGAMGFYTEKMAQQGLIGLAMVTSPEFVAPHGAKQPILGTNPICCAVPTDAGLMLMDQATAAFPWFGLLEAKTAGRAIPEGVAFDADGLPTTDPNKALKGALRTFDRGYKSSNLALMVELLAGPLVGGAHVSSSRSNNSAQPGRITCVALGDPCVREWALRGVGVHSCLLPPPARRACTPRAHGVCTHAFPSHRPSRAAGQQAHSQELGQPADRHRPGDAWRRGVLLQERWRGAGARAQCGEAARRE